MEIPGGKRKHGPLGERQEFPCGWSIEGERSAVKR